MKIKISDKVKPFTFTIHAKDLLGHLARLEGVTGYTSKSDSGRHHLFISYKGSLFLLGYSDTTYGIIKLADVDLEGDGTFNCPDPARLRQLLKNRAEMQFNYDGEQLKFRSVKGKFSGSLNATPLTADQIPRIEEYVKNKAGEAEPLSSELLNKIREGVACTRIIDPYMNTTLLIYITIEKKLIRINSNDNYHLAMYENAVPKKSPKLRMAFPASMFEVVDKFVDDSPATFFLESKSFKVIGDNFIVGLPPVEVREEAYGVCRQYFDTIGKPDIRFTTDVTIKDAIDNLMALNADGASLKLMVNPKGIIKLQLSTDHGQAEESLKVSELKMKSKKVVSADLDPPTLNDLLSKLKKGEVIVELFSDDSGKNIAQCIFRNKPSDTSNLVLATAT